MLWGLSGRIVFEADGVHAEGICGMMMMMMVKINTTLQQVDQAVNDFVDLTTQSNQKLGRT